MDILVSFVNAFPERPALCLLDAATFAVRVVPVPGDRNCFTGVRGLWLSDRYLYLARQEVMGLTHPALFIFDRSNFHLLGQYSFRLTGDIHSLWASSNEMLYAVSTGTDEVLKLEMRGPEVVSESVIWRPEPAGPRSDMHHLNAICGWNGDLLVSGFGKKPEIKWTSASDGFVFTITRGERMAGAIQNPHSLLPLGETFVYCESKTQMIRMFNDSRRQQLPGYTRGLCLAGDKLFVGTSVGRKASRTTGMMNSATLGGGPLAGRCTVSRLSIDNFEIEETVDLGSYGREIYDLLPIQGTGEWPTVEVDEFPAHKELWFERLENAKREIAQAIPAGEPYLLLDEDSWGPGEVVPGRQRVAFLERDGQYWAPLDDEAGIHQLNELRKSGTNFMVFAWPAFWWFDYYQGFGHHLRSRYRCSLENERVVIFDLQA
jgi:hypothetical protein